MITFVCLKCKYIDESDKFYEKLQSKVCPKCNNKKSNRIVCTNRLINFYDKMQTFYRNIESEDFDDDDIFNVLDEEFSRR